MIPHGGEAGNKAILKEKKTPEIASPFSGRARNDKIVDAGNDKIVDAGNDKIVDADMQLNL